MSGCQGKEEMTWWEAIHLNLANLVAGFAGGVVNAFVFKRSDPWGIIGSVVVGALTANYLGSMLALYIKTTEPVAAFLVGMGGMGLVQGLLAIIHKRIKLNGTEGPP